MNSHFDNKEGLKVQKKILFQQNEGHGGFCIGSYEKNAIHPTSINWTRQSRFEGPKKPIKKWEVNLESSIRGLISIDQNGVIYLGGENGTLFQIQEDGNYCTIKIPIAKKLGIHRSSPTNRQNLFPQFYY